MIRTVSPFSCLQRAEGAYVPLLQASDMLRNTESTRFKHISTNIRETINWETLWSVIRMYTRFLAAGGYPVLPTSQTDAE